MLFSAAHQQICSSPAAAASRPRQRPRHHDQAPAVHNEQRRIQRPGHHDQVPREQKRGRGQQLGQGPHTQKLGTNSDDHPCSVALFVVNSEPHTGARPSVRLCAGPELSRCVHSKLRAPHRDTSLGPFVCGARASWLCSYEHSEQARAPRTNGPRDVPRFGAVSLLQKPLHHMGIQINYFPAFFALGLNPVVSCARVYHAISDPCSAARRQLSNVVRPATESRRFTRSLRNWRCSAQQPD